MSEAFDRVRRTFDELVSAIRARVNCQIRLVLCGMPALLDASSSPGPVAETVIAPLFAGGTLVGRLHASRGPEPFSPSERETLFTMSRFVAAAVLGIREVVQSQARLEEAEHLLEVGRATASLQEPAEVAAKASAFIARLVPPPNLFAIFALSEDGRFLTHLASGVDAEKKAQLEQMRFSLEETATAPVFSAMRRRAFFESRSIYSEDVLEEPGSNKDLARRFGVRTYLAIPILAGGEPLGLLEIANPHARHVYDESVQRMLSGIADQLAISLRNARLARENGRRLEELRALSRRLWTVQEEERRRIARELHDEAGQAMTALKLNLDLARKEDDPAKVRSRVLDAVELASNVLEELRRIARDLRPASLDDLGLLPALRALVEGFGARSGIKAEFVHDASPLPKPNSDGAATVYRFVQEALTNVARHAHASWVRVRLQGDASDLFVQVEDDGVGFDTLNELSLESLGGGAAGGTRLGILGMRERARMLGGRVTLEPREGRGARLNLQIPAIKSGVLGSD